MLVSRMQRSARDMHSDGLEFLIAGLYSFAALGANPQHSMPEHSFRDAAISAFAAGANWRPALFFLLVGTTSAGFLWLGVIALSPGGFTWLDLLLVLLFAITLPWYVIGFWNSTIGLLILGFARDPIAAITPVVARVRGDEPITASTAILLCIRNEAPERVARLIEPLLEGLAASGSGERFHLYVLSDTSLPDIAAAEKSRFAAMADAWRGRVALTYRRRTSNAGYKAGNIRDFCERWGKRHDFAITLDADSAMSVNLVLKLVRIMQLDPKIGILQSLVIGMPSASPFARIFQFGMRLAMRSYTIGSGWWQTDCAVYWGHNAIIRLAPFIACCKLPVLDESALVKGHVLSHDQIESVLMQKAGYEVRVLAEEGSSFEQNPPTLLEFIRRDLRWCQGNMQYWQFLRAPDLRVVSRYQLLLGILMFLGSPAWIGLLLLGAAGTAMAPTPADFMRADAGIALLLLVLVMWFAPNIATVVDVLTKPRQRQLFGGAIRFCASFAITVVFVLLLSPVSWASHTVFLGRLLLGRTILWGEQSRDDHVVPWSVAARQLWPQTLIGLLPILLLAASAPGAIPYALLLAMGPLAAIPFAVATASPAVGRALIALGLDRLPEESVPPPELLALKLPAIELTQRLGSRRGISPPERGRSACGASRVGVKAQETAVINGPPPDRLAALRRIADASRRRAWRVRTAAEGRLCSPFQGEVLASRLHMHEAWRAGRGVVRSLRLYYGDRERRAAMLHLYGRFVKPGDLVFDIGAHVGDRVAVFRELGARIVAVEPQPALIKTLRLLYGRDHAIRIEPVAIAGSAGRLELKLNLDNPTISTASTAFVQAAHAAPGWCRETWSKCIDVRAATLDSLIERHGMPAFVKIDVEGFEAEVLAGLTHAVPALSFEFTTIQPEVAAASIARCAKLGYGRFNAILGERHSLIHSHWLDAGEIAAWLASLPIEANSGDIYALTKSGPVESIDQQILQNPAAALLG